MMRGWVNLSIDPLNDKFPGYTPYLFAGNKPVWMIDRDGEEEVCYTINISKTGEITYKITYYSNIDGIPDFKEVKVTYEGQEMATYLFTYVGLNGDPNPPPFSGGHNGLDQFDEFIISLVRDPQGTMQNSNYTTTEQIKKEFLKDIAAAILFKKLLKQRDAVKTSPPTVKKPDQNTEPRKMKKCGMQRNKPTGKSMTQILEKNCIGTNQSPEVVNGIWDINPETNIEKYGKIIWTVKLIKRNS
jgi:hypothetical protein